MPPNLYVLGNKTTVYTNNSLVEMESNKQLVASCQIQPIEENKNLLTYLLTPWCRVLPEQLTGLQLVKKFPAFHGTRRFITALTSVRHLSLSWAGPIQSTCPHPTSWRSILILSTQHCVLLLKLLFLSAFVCQIEISEFWFV